MSTPLISIVIPVYNVEEYIRDCMDSIEPNMLEGIECIVVNDGTKDDSINILTREYEGLIKNENFRLFNIENRGLSGARNFGIEKSQGKYIAFLDSDDVMHPSYMNIVKDFLKHGELDILEIDYKVFHMDCLFSDFEKNKLEYYNTLDILESKFQEFQWFASKYICKRDLLGIDFFPRGRNFEDVATMPNLFLESRNYAKLNEELYGYRQRKNSIVSSASEKKTSDLCWVHTNGLQKLKKFDLLTSIFNIKMIRNIMDSFQDRKLSYGKWRMERGNLMKNGVSLPDKFYMTRLDRLFIKAPIVYFFTRKLIRFKRKFITYNF